MPLPRLVNSVVCVCWKAVVEKNLLARLQLLGKQGQKIATLRATRQSLFIRKTFAVTPPRVSFNLHTTAGVSYKGECSSIFLSILAGPVLPTVWMQP